MHLQYSSHPRSHNPTHQSLMFPLLGHPFKYSLPISSTSLIHLLLPPDCFCVSKLRRFGIRDGERVSGRVYWICHRFHLCNVLSLAQHNIPLYTFVSAFQPPDTRDEFSLGGTPSGGRRYFHCPVLGRGPLQPAESGAGFEDREKVTLISTAPSEEQERRRCGTEESSRPRWAWGAPPRPETSGYIT